MHPIFFEFTLPGTLARFSWMLSLAVSLCVLGLAALIRARRVVTFGILTACGAVALLFSNRSGHQTPVHVVISSFGASLAAGITAGSWLITRAAARIGVAQPTSVRWLGTGLVAGFLGARLGYDWVNSTSGSNWHPGLNFEQGGLFGYGAYVGGLLGATLAARGNARTFRNWLDTAAPTLLVCTALARLGCYLQGCDFGRPLGLRAPRVLVMLGTYPRWKPAADGSFFGAAAWLHHVSLYGLSTDTVASLPTHPCQLYEAAFVLFAAILVLALSKSKPFAGSVFLTSAVLFSAGKYLVEFFRGDPDRGLMSWGHTTEVRFFGSFSQLFAIGSILTSALVWRRWQRGAGVRSAASPRR
jgi:phosphatidylglycerol---prolipoprotein diacylglyceryl transferase